MSKLIAYQGNTKCKPNNTTIIMDETKMVPVSTGGSFRLSGGDILHISEKDTHLDPWHQGDDYRGISLTLESGAEFLAWYSPNYRRDGFYPVESSYGAFWDLNYDGHYYHTYSVGSIIRIYKYPSGDMYDYRESWSAEDYAWKECQLTPCAVIKIYEDDGGTLWWELVDDDPCYSGQTFILNSGEIIYLSGLSGVDSLGIYFTRDSGKQSIGYYYDSQDSLLAESGFNYFGIGREPNSGDYIHLYDYGEEDYHSFDWGQPWWDVYYNDESVIQGEGVLHLADFEYDNTNTAWRLVHDYTTSV